MGNVGGYRAVELANTPLAPSSFPRNNLVAIVHLSVSLSDPAEEERRIRKAVAVIAEIVVDSLSIAATDPVNDNAAPAYL